MCMKFEQQLEDHHDIQLFMGNIDDRMLLFLYIAFVITLQELLDGGEVLEIELVRVR